MTATIHPLRISPKRQSILESELRATLSRHALMAALINANKVVMAIAQELQDEADERAAVMAMIGYENEGGQ